MLVLTLMEKDLEENLKILERERPWIDAVELRVDALVSEEQGRADSFPERAGVPVILGLKRSGEGGCFNGEERERIALLRRLLPGGFDFLELEEDLPREALSFDTLKKDPRIIRSLYHPAGVPENLLSRLKSLRKREDEIPKIVLEPRGTADLVQIFKQLRDSKVPEKGSWILETRGSFGASTRVLLPSRGSLITYTLSGGDRETGLYSPREMIDVFGIKRISTGTMIFGVYGNPVSQSLSPKIHNLGYSLQDLNALYLPFLVDDWEAGLELAEILGIRGFSITAPHKENAAATAVLKEESVTITGACNTLVREGNLFRGYNTDVAGFLTALREQLERAEVWGQWNQKGIETSESGGYGILPGYPVLLPPLRGVKVLVAGAGGAARAVVYALNLCGGKVTITNRTFPKAETLAEKLGGQALPLENLSEETYSIIIQTTSLGMDKGHPLSGEDPQDPLGAYRFTGRETVMDIIYKPAETPFLKRARVSGCNTENGLAMLVAQGMHQYRFFTGQEYPLTLQETLERIRL